MAITDRIVGAAKAAASAWRVDSTPVATTQPRQDAGVTGTGPRGAVHHGQQGGWVNTMTGQGTARDSGAYDEYQRRDELTREKIDESTAGAYAMRLVSRPAKDATRRGWSHTWGYAGDPVADGTDRLEDEADRAGLHAELRKALLYREQYGRGALVVEAEDAHSLSGDDGLDLATPVHWFSIRRVRRFCAVHRFELIAVPGSESADQLDPNHGLPTLYDVKRDGTKGGVNVVRVHASRLIDFPGDGLSPLERKHRHGAGVPVIDQVWDELRQYGSSHGKAYGLMSKAAIDVLKVMGLSKLMQKQGPAWVQNRFESLQMAWGTFKAIVLDGGTPEKPTTEAFERQQLQLGGVPDLLDRFALGLSGARGIPATLLFGRSPAGQNATGESDLINYYDERASFQTIDVAPGLRTGYRYLFRARFWGDPDEEGLTLSPYGQQVPAGWGLTFESLWEPKPVEQAQIQLMNVQALTAMVSTGVLGPEEALMAEQAQPFSLTASLPPDVFASPSPDDEDDAQGDDTIPPDDSDQDQAADGDEG